MKKLLTIILAFTFFAAHAQKVTTDVDESVDFTKYDSYQFLGWQDGSDNVMNDFDKKRMRDAFQSELKSRNLKLAESDGSLAISLYVVVTKETSTTAYTSYHGGTGYGRRGRGWGNGYSTTSYSESDYLKGTLVMDVFDSETKELIWQGVATGTVNEKPEKREKSIPKMIKKLMKKFPIKPAK